MVYFGIFKSSIKNKTRDNSIFLRIIYSAEEKFYEMQSKKFPKSFYSCDWK